jgi:hypothetical protein
MAILIQITTIKEEKMIMAYIHRLFRQKFVTIAENRDHKIGPRIFDSTISIGPRFQPTVIIINSFTLCSLTESRTTHDIIVKSSKDKHL